jgi:hypothetical protein
MQKFRKMEKQETENREFAKAMYRLDNIIKIEIDMSKANDKLQEFIEKNPNKLCSLSKDNNIGFNHFIPKMFCDLLDAIDSGKLIFKEDAKI